MGFRIFGVTEVSLNIFARAYLLNSCLPGGPQCYGLYHGLSALLLHRRTSWVHGERLAGLCRIPQRKWHALTIDLLVLKSGRMSVVAA